MPLLLVPCPASRRAWHNPRKCQAQEPQKQVFWDDAMTFVPGKCESYARGSFRIRGLFRGASSMMFSHLCFFWIVAAVLAGGGTQDTNSSAGVVASGAKLEKLW